MKKLTFALLSILLSACTVAAPTPSATPAPMVTAALEVSSTPTATPTSTAQPSTILISTPTPKPLQPYEVIETQVATFPVKCEIVHGGIHSISPNEKWLAAACGGDGKNSNLEILNREGQHWPLKLINYVSKENIDNGVTGPGGLHPEHWSNDGAYFYFSSSLAFSGGGNPCIQSFGRLGLYRIRLSDGNITAILPVSSSSSYFFAISPTSQQLAYEDADTLRIRDLQNGVELNTQDYGLISNPIWSKDANRLIYITCSASGANNPPTVEKSALKIFSRISNTTRTIFETEKGVISIDDTDTDRIAISIQNEYGSWVTDVGTFNLNSNQWITPIISTTPTPITATQIAEFPTSCLDSYGNNLSPNGKWLAVACRGNGKSINLKISNEEGKNWLLKFIDYGGENAPGELRVQHWSNDGQYLYFSPSLGLSGGGSPCIHSFGLQGLYRMTLSDGNVATILPPSNYFFAFASTDRRFAYQGDGNLIIRDLQTGDETNTGQSGLTDHPIWTKDGKELFYATCHSNWDRTPAQIENSAIKAFSITSNTSRTIIEKEKMFLSITNWDTNDVLTISSHNDSYTIYIEEYFDLNTNLWVTPTPTP